MSENHVFILQNQDKLFLNKQNVWVDGREPQVVFKTKHKDEALNQSFEATSKDHSARIQILVCPTKPNGLPDIDPAILPPPLAKPVAEESSEDPVATLVNTDADNEACKETIAEITND